MNSDADLEDWLRLALTPGLGAGGARRLLEIFGLPGNIFAAPAAALKQVLPPAVATALSLPMPAPLADTIKRTIDWAGQPGNRLMTLADADYPSSLLEIPDPPVLLYLKGRSDLLDQASLAIVGSRNASVQGMANARQFAQALSAAGVTVVSGLALGIDTAAHEGSLAAGAQGGSTVAVIGTGIDLVYPACNHALAHQIASLGCLVSEYPLGAPGVAANFPRRNRLISGLSQGVLVVEAAARSGSLITARLALEQGRDVFAIPGSIHSALSKGCHLLIRQGAKLVESAQHILEELPRLAALEAALSRRVMQQATAAPAQARDQDSVMGATTSQPGEQLQAPQSGLDDEMLLDLLGYDPVDSVQFAQRCGLDPAAAAAWMLAMELAGQVSRGPGGIYQRLVKS